jgi:hypothetical protein
MPYVPRPRRQVVARDFGAGHRIENAHLDARGVTREDREIDAALGPRSTQGSRQTRLNQLQMKYAVPIQFMLRVIIGRLACAGVQNLTLRSIK